MTGTPALPSWEKAYKTPRMKAETDRLRIERRRRTACHGTWRTTCEQAGCGVRLPSQAPATVDHRRRK